MEKVVDKQGVSIYNFNREQNIHLRCEEGVVENILSTYAVE